MSQVVTWAIALRALVVSVVTYRLNVRDRRHAWEAQERAQAEEVAGLLVREMCEEHKEMEWKAYVRNSSRSPVYNVLYVIHDSQDLDAALPEMIPLIPPDFGRAVRRQDVHGRDSRRKERSQTGSLVARRSP